MPTPSPQARTHDGFFDSSEALLYTMHVDGNQTPPETSGMRRAQEEHRTQETERNTPCLHVLQEREKSASHCHEWRAMKETPLYLDRQARRQPRKQDSIGQPVDIGGMCLLLWFLRISCIYPPTPRKPDPVFSQLPRSKFVHKLLS